MTAYFDKVLISSYTGLRQAALLLLPLLLLSHVSAAQTSVEQDVSEASVSISDEVQSLKQEVIELNRDLQILEEDLLYPANTRVAVFVSLDVGEFFQLDAVHLTLDGKEATNFLYSEKQVDALFRGGVQRLFLGNVSNGEHELSAFFTGKGPQGRDYRRAVTHTFHKDSAVKRLELQIRDSLQLHQPVLTVKEWK